MMILKSATKNLKKKEHLRKIFMNYYKSDRESAGRICYQVKWNQLRSIAGINWCRNTEEKKSRRGRRGDALT